MKQLTITKNLIWIALAIMAISFLGCEDDEDDFPQVKSVFTYTLDELTGAVTFLNISENADNFEWDFGDSTTSTEINPVKVYKTGTYNVMLRALNDAGASDTFVDAVVVDIDIPLTLPLTFDNPVQLRSF